MSANVEPIFPRTIYCPGKQLFSEDGAVTRTIGTGANPPRVIAEGGDNGAIIGDMWVLPLGIVSANILRVFQRNSAGDWDLLLEHAITAVTNDAAAIALQRVTLPKILSPNCSSLVDKKEGLLLPPNEAIGVGVGTALAGVQGINIWCSGGLY